MQPFGHTEDKVREREREEVSALMTVLESKCVVNDGRVAAFSFVVVAVDVGSRLR